MVLGQGRRSRWLTLDWCFVPVCYYPPQEISNKISYPDGMKPSDARSLSPQAQQTLRQRVIHTMQAQRLRPAQAARLFGLHRATVGRWWKALQRYDPDALLGRRRGRKPRPCSPRPGGAPARLSRTEDERIRPHVQRTILLPRCMWADSKRFQTPPIRRTNGIGSLSRSGATFAMGLANKRFHPRLTFRRSNHARNFQIP
jgi:hypothetical protein